MKRELLSTFILGALFISSCEHKAVENNVQKASLSSLNDSKEVRRVVKMTPEDFINKAYKSNRMEVEFGQMAQQKAGNKEVKDFGSKMVSDHTRANNDLMKLAEDKKVKLPDEKSMGMMEKEKRRELENKTGSKFDSAYMDFMIKEHKKDLDFYQKSMKEIDDQAINKYAMNTAEVVKSHIQKAEEIKQMLDQNSASMKKH